MSSMILLGLIAWFALWVGHKRGFFSFSPGNWEVPLRLVHVLGGFAIYFFATLLFTYLFLTLWKQNLFVDATFFSTAFNFAVSCLILFGLIAYTKKLPEGFFLERTPQKHHFLDDIFTAFWAWAIAFPLVLVLSQILELIIAQIFHLEHLPDQLAVHFIKSTFNQPLYFSLASISVIFLAPLIEETLFRGLLQTYIRRVLGRKQAIFITSISFSLFHYSHQQSLANIPILFSLFVLALFLGFIYEKRRCLLAPITLHASFNAVSVLNLYFLGDFTASQ